MKHLLFYIICVSICFCDQKQVVDLNFLETALPGSVSVDFELINRLTSDIKSRKLQNIHSLLIIKDDRLITEEYGAGFKKDRLHYSASVTKSFTSALLGIAIDQGYFKDSIQTVLNKNVSELFPAFVKTIQKDSLKKELKLKHILSMTAGFNWDEHSYPYSDSRNDCNRINNSTDPMNFLFDRKLVQNPGEAFYYNGGLSLSLSYLIEQYTEMPVDEFAEKYLFGPLDIVDYRWETVANGLIDSDGGLHLKPMDQAKLGYLFLNSGNWNNQQIISEEWVSISTEMRINNENMPDYAYQWWGGNYTVADQTFAMYLASGHGGQKIVVIPDYNTVVVITQQVFENDFGDLNFIAIMSDYILPALNPSISKYETINIDTIQLVKYQGHYVSDDQTEYIDFILQDNYLVGESSDGQTNTFIPVSEHIFRTRIMDLFDLYIKFNKDTSGNVVSLRSDFAFTHKLFNKSIK